MPVEKPRLLVVENREEILEIVRSVFSNEYALDIESDGTSAPDTAHAVEPDLVLLNTGLCEIESIRRKRDVPIAVFTARNESDHITGCIRAGAADFIGEPVLPELLRTRVKNLLALSRRKTEERELTHMLCHDLATPLENILDLLSIVENDATQTAEYIPLLEESALNGRQVIELLRRTRLFEETTVGLQSVSVRESLAQSERILAYQLRKKGLTMKNTIGPDLFVVAERVSFVNFVLNNLLSNAIKYSHPGGTITVEAHLDARIVHIVIRDTGIGMPPTILNTLFDGKSAVIRPGTHGEEGTGYGMPRIHRFVTGYGGTVRVQSSESTGTEVTLSLKPAD